MITKTQIDGLTSRDINTLRLARWRLRGWPGHTLYEYDLALFAQQTSDEELLATRNLGKITLAHIRAKWPYEPALRGVRVRWEDRDPDGDAAQMTNWIEDRCNSQ